jgi:hypothetical protein
MKCLIVLLFAVCFASSAQCPTCNREWQKKKYPWPYETEWQYVCVPSGRSDDAQVTVTGREIKVWSRGGDYGEYQTVEQAKKKGESVVRWRRLTCP